MSQTDSQAVGDLVNPPAAAWVRFLRSYGPTPNNLMSKPLLDAMFRHIESSVPGSLLIAGTAHDGKTYHCRAL